MSRTLHEIHADARQITAHRARTAWAPEVAADMLRLLGDAREQNETLQDFAKSVGIPAPTLSSWSKGKTTGWTDWPDLQAELAKRGAALAAQPSKSAIPALDTQPGPAERAHDACLAVPGWWFYGYPCPSDTADKTVRELRLYGSTQALDLVRGLPQAQAENKEMRSAISLAVADLECVGLNITKDADGPSLINRYTFNAAVAAAAGAFQELRSVRAELATAQANPERFLTAGGFIFEQPFTATNGDAYSVFGRANAIQALAAMTSGQADRITHLQTELAQAKVDPAAVDLATQHEQIADARATAKIAADRADRFASANDKLEATMQTQRLAIERLETDVRKWRMTLAEAQVRELERSLTEVRIQVGNALSMLTPGQVAASVAAATRSELERVTEELSDTSDMLLDLVDTVAQIVQCFRDRRAGQPGRRPGAAPARATAELSADALASKIAAELGARDHKVAHAPARVSPRTVFETMNDHARKTPNTRR